MEGVSMCLLHYCLKPVAGKSVNDGLCAVIHGFGTVNNGTAVLVVLNVLDCGDAVAERFGTVADGAAARNPANNVKPVLNFGRSQVNVRKVKMHDLIACVIIHLNILFFKYFEFQSIYSFIHVHSSMFIHPPLRPPLSRPVF